MEQKLAEKIRCIVVDDEHPARQLMTSYVEKIPNLELSGVFKNAIEAMAFLQQNTVDIMFLDIQMPDLTGIELLKSLSNAPLVIFTTAYSEYALDGYELEVFDYLLKPIPFPRFLQAVNKAIQQIQLKRQASAPGPNPDKGSQIQSYKDGYLTVKADYKIYRISYHDLIYIEGQREYVTFHTVRQKITALAALRQLEEQLPTQSFVRIHKSYIVNVERIDALDGNRLEVNGEKLPIGKSYRDNVMQLFY